MSLMLTCHAPVPPLRAVHLHLPRQPGHDGEVLRELVGLDAPPSRAELAARDIGGQEE